MELVSESHRDAINVYSNLTEITKRIIKTENSREDAWPETFNIYA